MSSHTVKQFAQYIGIVGSLITIFSSFRNDPASNSSSVKHPMLSILIGLYILANFTGMIDTNFTNTILMDVALKSGMNIPISVGNLIIISALGFLAADVISAAKYKRRLRKIQLAKLPTTSPLNTTPAGLIR